MFWTPLYNKERSYPSGSRDHERVYHVVFDDSFSTVASLQDIDESPSFWIGFDLDEFLYQIPLDKDSAILLDDDWLTPQEREERERQNVRATQIRDRDQPMPALLTNGSIS